MRNPTSDARLGSMAANPISAVRAFRLSRTAGTPFSGVIVTGTPSFRPSFSESSLTGPLTAPVFGSTFPCVGLLPRNVTRRVPAGAIACLAPASSDWAGWAAWAAVTRGTERCQEADYSHQVLTHFAGAAVPFRAAF